LSRPAVHIAVLAGFAAAWAGLLVFDIIVFGMTVAKAIRVGRMGDRTLIIVLLQDGQSIFITPRLKIIR